MPQTGINATARAENMGVIHHSNTKLRDANSRRRSTVVVIALCVLVVFYCLYAYLQRSDSLIEAQFLHYDFLNQLANGSITERGFFTRYAEHIYPIYNILLAANHFLFNVSGYFDDAVFTIFTVFTAIVFVRQLYFSHAERSWLDVIAIVAASAAMLSIVQAPLWGMVMAFHVGVGLFIVIAAAIENASRHETPQVSLLAHVLIPVSLLLCLGGYGIGLIAATIAGAVAMGLRRPATWPQAIAVIVVVLVSTAIYAWLLMRQGSIFANAPRPEASVLDMVQFGVLMIGNSALGWGFQGPTYAVTAYLICGSVILAATLVIVGVLVWRVIAGKLRDNDIFIGMLIAYSLANVAIVSIFRISNGVLGGLGQWYLTHTVFLPAIVLYFLIHTAGECLLKPRMNLLAGVPVVAAIAVVVFGAAWGVRVELARAPYVGAWKTQYAEQAPALLALPASEVDRSNNQTTMLWDYDTVKRGLNTLYTTGSWIFHAQSPIVQGVQSDGWMTTDADVVIVCPVDSVGVDFRVWRPDDQPPGSLIVKSNGGSAKIPVNGQLMRVPAVDGVAAIVIALKNQTLAPIIRSPTDERPLVATLRDVYCKMAPA